MIKVDGITLTLSELPGGGGVTLEVSPPVVAVPLKMIFDSSGVKITATGLGSVAITPSGVSLDDGALEVT